MTEVEQLENQHAQAKELIERRDMALRLQQNRDFKKLILEGFFEKDCAHYARASGDPALNEEQRADSLALAQAAGHFKRWLSVVFQAGNHADGQMASLEDVLSEARAEEDGGAA